MENMNWYQLLNKPKLCPPNWIFAPVWACLYFMIGLAFFLFLKGGNVNSKLLPMLFFGVQMILNFLWSGVFFGMKNIKGAFIVLIFLVIFLLGTLISFWPFSKTAVFLLCPYFLWCVFALWLNYEFLKLNP